MDLTINETILELLLGTSQNFTGSNYSVRIDQINSNLLYRGEALAGSAESSALWRIQKITITGVDVTVEWADGVSTFTKIWNNRLTYTYS